MKLRTRKVLTLLLVAAMVVSLAVPAFAADGGYSATPYTYDAGDYTFGKISHADKATGQPDGLVDYTGDGTVAVTGTVEGADGQGDRGQSYSWAAMAYGDYVYVGTCYAAMGKTLSAMDNVMGHKFDEEVMRAELNAIFNGTIFYGEEDGGVSDGILVKVNVHTGEMKLIMANSLNNVTPLFRNAILYKDKIYFCGSVSANGRVGLPSIYEVDPTDDSFKCVYTGLSNMQEYVQAYKEGVCTGIRGMAVYDGKLVISNVGVDGGYLLISDNPSEGFTKIATQSDLFNYPAVHFVDSVYGGGIWEMVEYNGSLYVAMCTGTPATRVGDNMRSFAIVRGDCSGDWSDPAAWTWTPVVGDKEADGAKYTFGIDPARTRAAACNLCIYDGYLYIGEYNDEEIPLEELMFDQDFGFLARNLEQSVNLYRMSIGSDGSEQMELVVGEATKMFPAGGILCKRSGFGDYENQYFWQSKVFDGKLFLGTFDTSSLLEPLGQFTNGDLLKMSREEWASQIGYLRVLLKLLLNQDKNGDGTLMAADADPDAAIDAAVDAVNDESPELFSFTDAQHDTLRQALKDGIYNARYSVSTLRQLRELNELLTELTDLVETNDIEGFVALYQKANDLYASLSGKLPEARQADALDDDLIAQAKGLRDKYEAAMERYAFQDALAEVFKVVARANKYIDETAPWALAKDMDANGARLATVMYNLLETTRICGVLLTPFMPESMTKLFAQIGADEAGQTWESAAAWGALSQTASVTKGENLFPRVDAEQAIAELEAAAKAAKKAALPVVEVEPQTEEKVDFDTFCKSDFRVVKVKDCQPVKKSNKLLCFTLDDGTGTDRQILSGIAAYYKPEELIGKSLVAIVNLPPRKMMGKESNGMLISAVHTEHGEEKLHLIMVDDAIPAGAKLG